MVADQQVAVHRYVTRDRGLPRCASGMPGRHSIDLASNFGQASTQAVLGSASWASIRSTGHSHGGLSETLSRKDSLHKATPQLIRQVCSLRARCCSVQRDNGALHANVRWKCHHRLLHTTIVRIHPARMNLRHRSTRARGPLHCVTEEYTIVNHSTGKNNDTNEESVTNNRHTGGALHILISSSHPRASQGEPFLLVYC